MKLPERKYKPVSNFLKFRTSHSNEPKLIKDAKKAANKPVLPELRGSFRGYTEKKLKRDPNFKERPINNVRKAMEKRLKQNKIKHLIRTNGGMKDVSLGVTHHFEGNRKFGQTARKIRKASKMNPFADFLNRKLA